MQDHTDDLALLHLGELKLREALACVNVVLRKGRISIRRKPDFQSTCLAAHEHDEDTPTNIGVHALLLGQLEEHTLCRFILLCASIRSRSILLTIDEWVTTPSCANKPPFALALSRMQIF